MSAVGGLQLKRSFTVLFAAAASGACTDLTICTTSVEPGIIVEIRDAVDDVPLAAGANGRVTDGTFSDSLRAYQMNAAGTLLSRAAADERKGTYVVEVSHPGFETWADSGVRVTENACHVHTVRLHARLSRSR